MKQRNKIVPLMSALVLALLFSISSQCAAQAVKITSGPTIEKADSSSATIAWSTNAGSSSRVWYSTDKNNLTHLAEAPYSGGTHRVPVKGLKPNTTYYFQVESGEGRGGSEAESQGILSFKTVAPGKPAITNEKPVIAQNGLANEENGRVKITSGPAVQSLTSDSAVVTWTTNVKGSSRVNYGTNPQNLTHLAEAPWGAGGLTHTVSIKNLTPNTNYYFDVETGQAQGTGGAEADSNKVMSFKTAGPGAPAQTSAGAQSAQSSAPSKAPLYRLTSAQGQDRLYTASADEAHQAERQGYHMEGVAGYVEAKPVAGAEPLYRLVRQNAGHSEHFYTANTQEKDTASREGFRVEGISGYVASSEQPGTVPLQRLEQPKTGEYLFTTSQPEAQKAATQYKYQPQGTCCYIWQH